MSSTTPKDLEPSEVDLVGQWLVSGGRVNDDEVLTPITPVQCDGSLALRVALAT